MRYLLLSSMLFFFYLPTLAFANDCPLRFREIKAGGTHIIAPNGFSFKLEPKGSGSSKTGWAKIQQKTHLGEALWDWVPLNTSGLLYSTDGKDGMSYLKVTPSTHQHKADWKLVTKYNPFDTADSRWIEASSINGALKCEVILEEDLYVEDSFYESVNVKALQIVKPSALFSQLGLG